MSEFTWESERNRRKDKPPLPRPVSEHRHATPPPAFPNLADLPASSLLPALGPPPKLGNGKYLDDMTRELAQRELAQANPVTGDWNCPALPEDPVDLKGNLPCPTSKP